MGPARYFQSQTLVAAAIQDNVHRLQLHPAYSYEDFIDQFDFIDLIYEFNKFNFVNKFVYF
jgi:hypothetical protein